MNRLIQWLYIKTPCAGWHLTGQYKALMHFAIIEGAFQTNITRSFNFLKDLALRFVP